MSLRPSRPMLGILLVVLVCACSPEHPAAPPSNRPPTILSVSAVPDTIALSDSTTIMCNAVDPDGDDLVYDWFTTIPLKIAGAPQGVYLYGTDSYTRVFYYAGPDSLTTYRRVQVFARDPGGLQDGVEFRVYLRD